MSGKSKIGIIGLGVMGRNLALNFEGKGIAVSAYDAWPEQVRIMKAAAEGRDICVCDSPEKFVASLSVPRNVLLMVKAGQTVDDTIKGIKPWLSKDDLIIDGGNSLFKDTMRRCNELEFEGLLFIGAGISGGEEGALNGPAIMPGGSREAYTRVAGLLEKISAKVLDTPCCDYIGPDGAGHFVKMVHNGIEYGDMQLICEVWDLLRRAGGFSTKELAELFEEWNEGELESYLIEITADILTKKDDITGLPMVDVILDKAGMKGTGAWTSQHALEIGAAIPTITEAVFARSISALKSEREQAAKLLSLPFETRKLMAEEKAELASTAKMALYASKIASYAQGFAQMALTSKEYGWNLELQRIASIFRGGCIIRASLLNDIMAAFVENPTFANLLLAPEIAKKMLACLPGWRKTVIFAVESGIPMPACMSALSYFESYRTEKLPANLLQAQRDYFGAHRFERTDIEGSFHHDWQK